jgi:hypothetical protein
MHTKKLKLRTKRFAITFIAFSVKRKFDEQNFQTKQLQSTQFPMTIDFSKNISNFNENAKSEIQNEHEIDYKVYQIKIKTNMKSIWMIRQFLEFVIY